MFLVYNQVTQSIANNIAGYNSGAWNFFFNEVANELTNLVTFCAKADVKKASLLNKDLAYIKQNVKEVYNLISNPNKKAFTYYNNENGTSSQVDGDRHIVLADPNNDTREDLTDTFKPKLNGGETIWMTEGIPQESIYDEEQHFDIGENIFTTTYLQQDDYTQYEPVNDEKEEYQRTLLGRTSKWFKQTANDYIEKRFKTIHSRFHTANNVLNDMREDIGNPSFSNKYGLSHGRNLLKESPDESFSYDNPYCRVWTWHHQYHKIIDDTMRPFKNDSGYAATLSELSSKNGWGRFRTPQENGFDDGSSRLGSYGAMYNNAGRPNGFVNITPSYVSGNYGDGQNVSIRHCMFSIENLAWKGMFSDYGNDLEYLGLSREQKGPLGGRIMWFPPYDLTFHEDSNARWDENTFIGRGEPMYTYSNTSRSGSLSFKLLIDHPAVLDYWNKNAKVGNPSESDVDNIDSKEQEYMRFFAGCTVLKANDPTPVPEEPTPEPKPEPKKEPTTKTVDNIAQFFVFYPNNYSGKDDKVNSELDPIEYLLNGIGTQEYYRDEDWSGHSVPQKTTKQTQIPLSMSTFWAKDTTRYGGYEMRSVGVSTVTNLTSGNVIGIVRGCDSETDVSNVNAGTKYNAAKMIGSEASGNSKDKNYNKKRYYYRADKNTLNQVLKSEPLSYIDRASFGLNAKGYKDAVTHYKIEDKDNTYSLTEVYVALKGDDSGVLSGLYDSTRVSTLKSILNGEKGKITTIHCKGMASTQANSKRASDNQSTLSKNRALTIQNWLKANLKVSGIEYLQESFKTSNEETKTDYNVNEKTAKITRMAFVEIHYSTEETEDASEAQAAIDDSGNAENNTTTTTNETKGSTEDTTTDTGSEISTKKYHTRYDEEGKFFKTMTQVDPIMTKLLSERIKYFNPAFHSMSPEGFNARLTFLNQCLRQGPTISGADSNNQNANNLSFGRPPVCVLRIGDFYNTKIIIETLSIEYDPLTWDLNEEGIGVMPMIASVTLSFKFIGGSELGGPIQRLQNALSYNYYANTSVYDNRSEKIWYEKDSLGTVKKFSAYNGNTN